MKVLIVSPSFPPTNTSDNHRVRMVLPFLKALGWDAEVIAVRPDRMASPQDPWLEEGLPRDVPVHRIGALGLGWARLPGLGGLGIRALPALRRTGDLLLKGGGFDLVYFSTTVFQVHVLGPWWKRKFGVPFVMDYQDPWVNDYYREHPQVTPPGGRIKYSMSEVIHRWMEPRVLQACSGITAVSAAYQEQLHLRYPWSRDIPCRVEPFPGAQSDFDRMHASTQVQTRFDPQDGRQHWVYAGAVIPAMEPALRAFFTALQETGESNIAQNLRLHFLGTSYALGDRSDSLVRKIALEFGLADIVEESRERIPYSETLRCLVDAQALLIFGSDDPGYTPSKIYPYLMARRPLLAIFQEQSPVIELMHKVGGGVCVPFSSADTPGSLAHRIGEQWLRSRAFERTLPLNHEAFQPYTDSGSAVALAAFFRYCVGA